VYAHASVGVFTRTRDALSPIPTGGFNFSVDGRSTCGSLAVFPRLKGRTKLISILSFWLFVGVVFKSLHDGTEYVISELVDYLEWFSLVVFVDSVRIHEITHRTTADQARFVYCTSQLCLWVNNRIEKIFLNLNISSKSATRNFYDQEGPSATPAPPLWSFQPRKWRSLLSLSLWFILSCDDLWVYIYCFGLLSYEKEKAILRLLHSLYRRSRGSPRWNVSSKNLWDCLPLIFLIQNGRVTLLIAMAENKKSEILWLVQLICLYERIERPPCWPCLYLPVMAPMLLFFPITQQQQNRLLKNKKRADLTCVVSPKTGHAGPTGRIHLRHVDSRPVAVAFAPLGKVKDIISPFSP
jgi:hypothetical protein